VLRALSTPKRFSAQAVPTGGGKSLIYMITALMQQPGKRTVILTATKGLEDQLEREFSDVVVDIRGISNYRCKMEHDFPGKYEAFKAQFPNREPNCEEGPCHAGRVCSLKEMGCLYYDKLRAAKKARIVLTNYSYWMSINRYGQGIGEFELLVLDEGHEAPDELAKFLRTSIGPWELEPLNIPVPRHKDVEMWAKWAKIAADRVGNLHSKLKAENPNAHAEFKRFEELAGKLLLLSTMGPDWIAEDEDDDAVAWEPKWPAKYAEQFLFLEIPKVAFFSATMIPKTLELVGVPPEDLDFHYYPSQYASGRHPFINVPNIRLNSKTHMGELYIWLQKIDELCGPRMDRKGIIHTISYDRMRFVLQNSIYRNYMLYNDPKNGRPTKEVVEQFKRASAPCILVSPSVGTGYDFPGKECEWQIVGKLPYPDTRSPVMSARAQEDKEYGNYLTAVALVQMAGRGMRGPDDLCETLMVDDSFRWFWKRCQHLMPLFFRDTVRWVDGVPNPLPKL
jgi:Rad3-related DNA helicase